MKNTPARLPVPLDAAARSASNRPTRGFGPASAVLLVAFAAVVVPAGTSEVELHFAPEGLGTALMIFALTAVFALVLWCVPARNRRARG